MANKFTEEIRQIVEEQIALVLYPLVLSDIISLTSNLTDEQKEWARHNLSWGVEIEKYAERDMP